MNDPLTTIPSAPLSSEEKRRRKREIILIVVIIAIVSVLTYVETRVIHFGIDFPISNTILMFILININLLLLILLIFLVFRNLVKLLIDRRRKVLGAKLRTRLVVAFIALTLLPAIVLFFFSISFITTSTEFWFNVPIEQALDNSLRVGRSLYNRAEDTNRFILEQAAYQIVTRKLLEEKRHTKLSNYIQIVQRAFNVDAVEVYSTNASRLTYATTPELEEVPFTVIPTDRVQRDMPPSGVRTITEDLSNGELVRTIGAVPFGAGPDGIEAYVAVSILIPPAVAENLNSISNGIEAYQQIKLLKKPIQITYYITLSIVGLLVVFCAIWFGFYVAKTITIPIMELAEATKRVAEGDLEFSIEQVADDEVGSLVHSFNRMTRDLRSSREQLELSARMLRDQNVEIEEKRQFLAIVLKNVSAGVITLDAHGIISTVNTSAERMLNIRGAEVLNRNYQEILTGGFLRQADDTISQLLQSPENAVAFPLRVTVEGRPRSFLFHVGALRDENGSHMGMVAVFDDLTELERAQRMAAWREVARRIAHEVKNPLTPISLSAQRLKRKYGTAISDPVFDECTRMIIDHVELIRNLVNEFSAFARFPAANPAPCKLLPIIEETIALYREGHPLVSFNLSSNGEPPILNMDRRQIKQALINLVDNAISAMRRRGRIDILVSEDAAQERVLIEVADSGPGIADDVKARLFEPNFSTKTTGMGLGLTIVNSIISDHQGRVRVEDNAPAGARFIIELPL
jgi:two-component system nitrogen regulation sensor histidine kinase NtrY